MTTNSNLAVEAVVVAMSLNHLQNHLGSHSLIVQTKNQKTKLKLINSTRDRSIKTNKKYRKMLHPFESRYYTMAMLLAFNKPLEGTTIKFVRIDLMTNTTSIKILISIVFQLFFQKYRTTWELEDNQAWERKCKLT